VVSSGRERLGRRDWQLTIAFASSYLPIRFNLWRDEPIGSNIKVNGNPAVAKNAEAGTKTDN